jgi:hypothetical protein
MIDPRIWDSQQVMRLTPVGFKLYIYLISQADDEGRLTACYQMMASRVFPFGGVSPEEIMELVIEMDKDGLIILYSVADKEYIAHPNWTRYQKIDRPTKSTLPIPIFDEGSTRARRGLVPNRIEVKGIERKEEVSTPSAPTRKSSAVPSVSYAEGVAMKSCEHSALVAQYGERVIGLAIEKVAAQQIKTGKAYKSPRGAILQWGIRAALEELKKTPMSRTAKPNPACPECGKELERDHGYWACKTHGRREDVE